MTSEIEINNTRVSTLISKSLKNKFLRDFPLVLKNIGIKNHLAITAIILSAFAVGCAAPSYSTCRITPDGKCAQVSKTSKISSEQTLYSSSQAPYYGYPRKGFEGRPVRIGESVQQIWIGPYEDQDGNFHEPSYVYTVVKKGSWLGDPVKDIQG